MPLFGLLNREWNSSTKKVSISQYTRADSCADSRVDSRAISRAIFLAMRIRPLLYEQLVEVFCSESEEAATFPSLSKNPI